MIKAKIVGATGYGGVGIIELLTAHPEVEIRALVAQAEVGRPVSAVYPHLTGYCDLNVVAPDDPSAREEADVVFFATPDRVAMKAAPAELDRGARVIDYSGDFRFDNEADYADYATRIGKDPHHESPDLLAEAVYGCPELFADRLTPDTRVVGNVGCFAVACTLGLAPAASAGALEGDRLICDCKTGVSGAGKKPSPLHHFPARLENLNAYRLTGHQHTCEVEKVLSGLAGRELKAAVTSQVVPMTRGILACLYAPLPEGWDRGTLIDTYRQFYAEAPFVRIFDRDAAIGTQHVRGSNYCNLIVDADERTGTLRVLSHIDNLVKGQAGNALQVMNRLFGLPETTGLDRPGQYP